MHELIRTNDPVVLSYAESLLRDFGIHCFIADQSISVLEGSIGAFQRRLMVDAEEIIRARRILTEAGLGAELRDA